MATWQFDFHFLPMESVRRHFGAVPLMINQAQFDQVQWWQEYTFPKNLLAELSLILPKAASWSKNIEIWGEEDKDRVDLARENGALAELYVRVDVRKISYTFLIQILGLARQYNWVLLTHDYRVLSPSFGKLLSAIQHSDSFKFVEDPRAFLLELENQSNISTQMTESQQKLISDLKDKRAINALYHSALKKHQYLDYDDARALAVKAMWVLRNLRDKVADEKLKLLTKDEDKVVRGGAVDQLQRKQEKLSATKFLFKALRKWVKRFKWNS